MRDPARINRILDLIDKVWKMYPDQRLGQLLYNYVGFTGDIFNYEDDVTEDLLSAFLEIKQKDLVK